MIHTLRAAGFAAAAFAFAAFTWGGPLKAWQGDGAAPIASHYLDHAAAAPVLDVLGLNETAAPDEAGLADPAAARHLLAPAEVELPQPRSLGELVDLYADSRTADREQHCLASAIYFEARGEPIEGQLAVAEVVLNRAASARYPSTICGVVTQRAQFSFVRGGRIPGANRASPAWRRAVALASIATGEVTRMLPRDVLWYHAEYVSPGWGRRLDRNTKIGLHIFYS